MALMLPPEFGAGHRNDAEKAIFERIRDETPETWVGLHHVGLIRHPRKPLAEIDFLVIGEPGVFCLEVKSGASRRVNGLWYAGDRPLDESPFVQVGSASAALRKELAAVHSFVYGYGCVFPDCPFEVAAPDVECEIVYDATSAAEPFAVYLERLGEYWHERYPNASRLKPADISRIAHELRRDFETVESLLPAVRTANRGIVYLTDQQVSAVAGLNEAKQVVVKGGAGTGKTLLAVHEALRLAAAGKRTLLTCYTKAVADHIANRVEHENLEVVHMDRLIQDLIDEAGTKDMVPADASKEDRFSLYRPLAAIAALEKLNRTSAWDALVVDEGQDLMTQPRVDVLDEMLVDGIKDGCWRVFWDPNQAIFSAGGDARLSVLTGHGSSPVHYPLSWNCRNTREIAQRIEILSGVRIDEVASIEGPEPVDREWDGRRTHVKRLRAAVKDWLEHGIAPESIVLLSPLKLENTVAAEDLGIGLPVNDISGGPLSGDPGSLDFATIQSFKGLEAEAVLLIDVSDLDSDGMRALLYVGASRARTLLGVLRSAETTTTFAKRAAELAQRPTPRDPQPVEIF